jgi:CRISPR-associated protein Cas2
MGRYKIMRLICFFDLPSVTEKERREYRKFRKALLENGFVMVQYSVYVRTCPNREYSKKFSSKLHVIAPEDGHIRLLTVTEKQYSDMVFILGNKSIQEEVIGDNRMVII